MRWIDNLAICLDMVNQVFENGTVLRWCRETDCIRNVDIASTSIDCSLYDLQEEIQFCPGSIFWREFHNLKFWASVRNVLFDRFKDFFLGLVEFKLPVNRTGCDKDVNLWILSILQGFITSINIWFDRTSQTCHGCLGQDLGNLLNSREGIRTSCRKTCFNSRNTPFFQLFSNGNFFFDREINSWSLFTVPKAGI